MSGFPTPPSSLLSPSRGGGSYYTLMWDKQNYSFISKLDVHNIIINAYLSNSKRLLRRSMYKKGSTFFLVLPYFYSFSKGQYPQAPSPGISFDKQHDFRIG